MVDRFNSSFVRTSKIVKIRERVKCVEQSMSLGNYPCVYSMERGQTGEKR